MSELDTILGSLVGDDEWSRHQILEKLRAEGAGPDRVRTLITALGSDDSGRRAGARMALAALADPASPARASAESALIDCLRAPLPDLRTLAASAMGESGNGGFAPALVEALDDPDPNVVAAAADALGMLSAPAAIGPLTSLTRHSAFWVRVAAVVALGRARDPRAIPALETAGRAAGLEAAVAEALRRIDDPAALPVLEGLHAALPTEALFAAGAILSSHSAIETPGWVVEAARQRESDLRSHLEEHDDPVAARLLGLAGTSGAIEHLLTLAGHPQRSEAALNGLLAARPDLRTEPILAAVGAAEPDDKVLLLSLLPPLEEPGQIERLVPLLSSRQGDVRAAAAEALARSPTSYSLRVLADELDRPRVAPEIVRASAALGAPACVALLPLLDDADPAVRAAAADALGRCADPAIGEDLAAALDREEDGRVRRALLGALGRTTKEAAVPALRRALEDPDPETRVAVIEALGSTGSADAIPDLAARLGGPPHERLAAIRALGEVDDPAAAGLIEPFLRDPDLETRRTAARAIFHAASTVPLPSVEALAEDPDGWLRGLAARMLAARGESARAALERLFAEDPDPAVRTEAWQGLERLS